MSLRKQITVSTCFAGFHCWPAAPDKVAFLRDLHRHKFGVEVTFEVTHPDRQLEFFIVQEAVNVAIHKSLIPAMRANSSMSCEMIGEHLFNCLKLANFDVRSVAVDEDGENSAKVFVE